MSDRDSFAAEGAVEVRGTFAPCFSGGVQLHSPGFPRFPQA